MERGERAGAAAVPPEFAEIGSILCGVPIASAAISDADEIGNRSSPVSSNFRSYASSRALSSKCSRSSEEIAGSFTGSDAMKLRSDAEFLASSTNSGSVTTRSGSTGSFRSRYPMPRSGSSLSEASNRTSASAILPTTETAGTSFSDLRVFFSGAAEARV